MSEEPTVTRKPDGKLQLNESAEMLVAALAEDHHEDSGDVLAEVRRGLPLARLFLRLAGLEVVEVRNGRPRDSERDRTIFFVTNSLVGKLGHAEAFKQAPGELKKLGVTDRGGRALSVKRIRAVYSDRDEGRVASRWFDGDRASSEDAD